LLKLRGSRNCGNVFKEGECMKELLKRYMPIMFVVAAISLVRVVMLHAAMPVPTPGNEYSLMALFNWVNSNNAAGTSLFLIMNDNKTGSVSASTKGVDKGYVVKNGTTKVCIQTDEELMTRLVSEGRLKAADKANYGKIAAFFTLPDKAGVRFYLNEPLPGKLAKVGTREVYPAGAILQKYDMNTQFREVIRSEGLPVPGVNRQYTITKLFESINTGIAQRNMLFFVVRDDNNGSAPSATKGVDAAYITTNGAVSVTIQQDDALIARLVSENRIKAQDKDAYTKIATYFTLPDKPGVKFYLNEPLPGRYSRVGSREVYPASALLQKFNVNAVLN